MLCFVGVDPVVDAAAGSVGSIVVAAVGAPAQNGPAVDALALALQPVLGPTGRAFHQHSKLPPSRSATCLPLQCNRQVQSRGHRHRVPPRYTRRTTRGTRPSTTADAGCSTQHAPAPSRAPTPGDRGQTQTQRVRDSATDRGRSAHDALAGGAQLGLTLSAPPGAGRN